MLLNAIEGGIPTFNIAGRRRQLRNYGEATIREICWNKWRGYIDGVGVIEFANTPEETAKHAANCWWAALHAQPWESQSALRNVTEMCKSVEGKIVTGQPSVAELSAPLASRDPLRLARKSEKSEAVKVLGLSERRAREASAVESLGIVEGASLWQQDIGQLTGHNLEARGREQVNRLLQEGWRLLHIYTLRYQEAGVWRERPMAILGKAREGRKGKKSLEACGERLQVGRQTDQLPSDRFF